MRDSFNDKTERLENSLQVIWPGYKPRSFAPEAKFIEAVGEIGQKEVRQEAIDILFDETEKIEGDEEHLYVSSPGLGGAVRLAQHFWNRQSPKPMSPVALKNEFEALGASMREVAGRLRMLSETAKHYIACMLL